MVGEGQRARNRVVHLAQCKVCMVKPLLAEAQLYPGETKPVSKHDYKRHTSMCDMIRQSISHNGHWGGPKTNVGQTTEEPPNHIVSLLRGTARCPKQETRFERHPVGVRRLHSTQSLAVMVQGSPCKPGLSQRYKPAVTLRSNENRPIKARKPSGEKGEGSQSYQSLSNRKEAVNADRTND